MTQAIAIPGGSTTPPRSLARGRRRLTGDALLRGLSGAAAGAIILMLVALVWVLTIAALPSMKQFGFGFITDPEWRPNELTVYKTDPATGHFVFDENDEKIVEKVLPPQYGAATMIYGTAISSLIALVIAVPTSFGAALFLVRIAHRWLVGPVSFLVEFLAAIPSIAYGIWGLLVLRPFLRDYLEPFLGKTIGQIPGLGWLFYFHDPVTGKVEPIRLTGNDMFCGGLVLAIMIMPIITAISRDVLRAVPRAQIEGTQALGATWWQSSREMLRYSRSALFGAVMLGLARAAGETMAVTMVIGNINQINASPFAPAQTMSSLLATKYGDAGFHPEIGDFSRPALAEVALILLAMSLVFNIVARYLVVGRGARTAAAH